MAAKGNSFDACHKWIADETKYQESSGYGSNKSRVEREIKEQNLRVSSIKSYKGKVEDAAKTEQKSDDAQRLHEAYVTLKAVSKHRTTCLQTTGAVAGLEDSFNLLSVDIAKRVTDLVTDVHATLPADDGQPRVSHECILGVRNTWSWVSKLLRCLDVHLKHASDYHQFWHEAEEYDGWMMSEVTRHLTAVQNLDASTKDSHEFLTTVKLALSTFLRWKVKIVDLHNRSRNLLPVPLRTTKTDILRPIVALCDYRTNEINVRETEELYLVDNSNHQVWLVQNIHGVEAKLPSIIFTIPGAATEAATLANKLVLVFLTMWTNCVRDAGHLLIKRLAYLISTWSKENDKLSAMESSEKETICRLVRLIHDSFHGCWGNCQLYTQLLTQMDATSKVLQSTGQTGTKDAAFIAQLLKDSQFTEDIINAYQEFWKQWELFKLYSQMFEHGDFMMLPQNMQDWQALKVANFTKKLNLGLEGLCHPLGEEVIEQEVAEIVETAKEEEVLDGVHDVAQSSYETEELSQAEQEERKTFVVTGVRSSAADICYQNVSSNDQRLLDVQQRPWYPKETATTSIHARRNASYTSAQLEGSTEVGSRPNTMTVSEEERSESWFKEELVVDAVEDAAELPSVTSSIFVSATNDRVSETNQDLYKYRSTGRSSLPMSASHHDRNGVESIQNETSGSEADLSSEEKRVEDPRTPQRKRSSKSEERTIVADDVKHFENQWKSGNVERFRSNEEMPVDHANKEEDRGNVVLEKGCEKSVTTTLKRYELNENDEWILVSQSNQPLAADKTDSADDIPKEVLGLTAGARVCYKVVRRVIEYEDGDECEYKFTEDITGGADRIIKQRSSQSKTLGSHERVSSVKSSEHTCKAAEDISSSVSRFQINSSKLTRDFDPQYRERLFRYHEKMLTPSDAGSNLDSCLNHEQTIIDRQRTADDLEIDPSTKIQSTIGSTYQRFKFSASESAVDSVVQRDQCVRVQPSRIESTAGHAIGRIQSFGSRRLLTYTPGTKDSVVRSVLLPLFVSLFLLIICLPLCGEVESNTCCLVNNLKSNLNLLLTYTSGPPPM